MQNILKNNLWKSSVIPDVAMVWKAIVNIA